jgi:superfamily I DNA/RNA helicase
MPTVNHIQSTPILSAGRVRQLHRITNRSTFGWLKRRKWRPLFITSLAPPQFDLSNTQFNYDLTEFRNTEDRRGTVSVFNGTTPVIKSLDSQEDEIRVVSEWLRDRSYEGIARHEIGVFVRSNAELERARSAVSKSGLPFKILDEHVETTSGYVFLSTMHLAKGLEFRAVAVMACDDEIIPSQERIETVADSGDLEEVYNTERHLLYVACTRARDHLLVTSVAPASEFLGDFNLVSN